MDPLTIGLTAASIAGSGFNTVQQGRMNKKSMAFSREMYEKQKADNLAFWKMQNDYNNPQEQMKRFQEAKLNPNLIYGSGSASAGNADAIKTPDVKQPEFRAPQIENIGHNLQQLYDVDIKSAQADNIRATTTATQEGTILTMLKQYGEGFENASKHIKAINDTELQQTSADIIRENLRKLKIENNFKLDESERASLLFKPTLQNSVEDILSKRLGRQVNTQQLRNLGLDQQVKELDAKLAGMGVRASDPFYAKAVAQLIGYATEYFKKDTQNPSKPSSLNPRQQKILKYGDLINRKFW